jgi:pterin-4a-carbinolamine dehydratase
VRRSRPLNDAEIDAVIQALPEWSLERDCPVRVIECGRFEVAMNLANRIADVASEAQRYPGISLDGRVLSLRLGAEGRGLTDRDYVLARMLSLRVFAE